MAERLRLKKYGNRRLYDTEKSAYVTLTQVSNMVKEGRQIEVIDAKTEEDVTAFILTQIIVEEAKNKNSLLPVPLLHLIIECGETVLHEFFEKYLELSIRNYLTYKTAFDEQFKRWLEIGGDMSALAPKSLSSFAPFTAFMTPFAESAKESKDKKKGD